MSLYAPPDIENAFREYLSALPEVTFVPVLADLKVFAGSTPPDLGQGSSVQILRISGQEFQSGIFQMIVSFDCRHPREGQALELCNVVLALVARSKEDQKVGEAIVVFARPVALPYLNPDPRNPALARCTTNFEIWTKAKIFKSHH